MDATHPTTWDRIVAFGERCHRYCAFLCIGEAIIFIGVLVLVIR